MRIEKGTNLLQLLSVRVAFFVLVLCHVSPAKIPFENYESNIGTYINTRKNPKTPLFNGTDYITEKLKGKYQTMSISVSCKKADCQGQYSTIEFYPSTLQNDIYVPDNDQIDKGNNYFANNYYVEIDDFSTAESETLFGFGQVDFVKGETVFGITLQKQNSELVLQGTKFFKKAAWQQTDQEPNSMANLGVFGLGPKSAYWDYILKNYEGPNGNNNIYAVIHSTYYNDSSYQMIRSEKPEETLYYNSRSFVILMGEEIEFTQYDGSSIQKDNTIPITPVLLENEGQDKGIWQVQSTISVDTGAGEEELLLEGKACFEIAKINFLTVKSQEVKDTFTKRISNMGCGTDDCVDVYIPETDLPNLKLSFSNAQNTISTPTYIYKSNIYTKSLTVREGFKVAIDVDAGIPEGCDFIYGMSLFSLSSVEFGISKNGDDEKLSTSMKIFPTTKFTDSVSSKWGLALQIIITVCILACILAGCVYSVYYCKYRKNVPRTYSGGLDQGEEPEAGGYTNGEALEHNNVVGAPQKTTIFGNPAQMVAATGYVPPIIAN